MREPEASIAAVAPEVAMQWHPTRNDIAVTEVDAQSTKGRWWQCGRGHEWVMAPVQRIGTNARCPLCPTR